jgi:hypothetical protein
MARVKAGTRVAVPRSGTHLRLPAGRRLTGVSFALVAAWALNSVIPSPQHYHPGERVPPRSFLRPQQSIMRDSYAALLPFPY